jgi:nicotinamidase-related amidase
MPCTTLDPKTALVVIDLQKGILSLAGDLAKPVLANAVKLVDAFRRSKQTVVLVNVAFAEDGADRPRGRSDAPLWPLPPMKDFAELLPELGAQASDVLVTKRQPNAFYGTELDLQLRRRGVTNIVLCGISTTAGVDGTARAAYERAYNLTFASDAMADRDPAMHELVTTKLFPRIGEVDTTDAILRHLK